ncbi:SDR family oxidoreductase [Conexibacter sp. SYSU D00693]|uniref:SDR family NAD(P)-dependent oxidoreductase n=1 Tax=Conexibacter sp. SYSU D00693 TaxID=2812560 RepID=UPI00196B2A78|nr:SDR family NAD(P)-dependent oxidoreductase [Conexibacter sp. SYSU D00693]
MELQGARVLLTGATGGIGHAIARRLHAAGAQLVLTGRRLDVLEPLAAELGGRAVAVDLAVREEVDRLAADCADVDVLVANAALPASGQFVEDFDLQRIDRALDVNLRAPIVLARALVPEMLARGRGHLVLISSIAGRTSAPGSSIYSATKFGLRGFAQGLRGDLHGTPVGASVVFPGFIRDAGMFHDSGAELPRGVGTSTPSDVAEAVESAIVRDRGEVTVAPVSMKALTTFAEVAPGLSAKVARLAGSDKVSASIAAGQQLDRHR